MSIQFLCPNGHQIRCPDEQAGRAAKCPKCGVKFRIPELAEIETLESDSGISPPGSDEVETPDEGPGEGEIEFLCPNGHRLHGPRSLQGRPGQCPECGSKFRIPSYDEVPDEDEEEPQEQIGVGRADGGDSGLDLEEVDVEEAEEAMEEVEELEPISEALDLSGLFPLLWKNRDAGASIEIQFGDGQTLAPDRFAKTLSGGRYGVFASKEPDESFTLVAIPWDSIACVRVRGVKELPEEMRE